MLKHFHLFTLLTTVAILLHIVTAQDVSTSEETTSTTTSSTTRTTTTANPYLSRCVVSTTNEVSVNLTTGVRPCYLCATNSCGNDSIEYCAPVSIYNGLFYDTLSCIMGVCQPVPPSTTTVSTSTTTTRTTSTTTTSTRTTSTTSTGSTTTTSTATTTTATTTPRYYGKFCTKDKDCGSIKCNTTTLTCTCPPCAQYVAEWTVNTATKKLVYIETCIPITTPVRTFGKSCDRFHYNPPSSACDAASACFKCPEYWNNTNIDATCKPIRFSTTKVNCTCGYLATCRIAGGQKKCTCPVGYQLHINGKDCYGWKTLGLGNCSVTCGIGTQSVNSTCDAPAELASPCLNVSRLTVQECRKSRCLFDAEAQKYAIDLCFKSAALSVPLFNKLVASPMKTNVADAMNAKCRSDSATFASCCPGKSWSKDVTGIYMSQNEVFLLNLDTDGSKFCLGLMLKPSPTNSLCSSASSGKRKRSADYLAINQSSLLTIAASPEVLSAINGAIQQVDPGAAISNSSIGLATTTTTTPATTRTTVAKEEVTYGSSYIKIGDEWVPWWVLVIGIIAPLIISGLTGLVIFRICKCTKKAAKVEQDTSPTSPATPSNIPEIRIASSERPVMYGAQVIPMPQMPPFGGTAPMTTEESEAYASFFSPSKSYAAPAIGSEVANKNNLYAAPPNPKLCDLYDPADATAL